MLSNWGELLLYFVNESSRIELGKPCFRFVSFAMYNYVHALLYKFGISKTILPVCENAHGFGTKLFDWGLIFHEIARPAAWYDVVECIMAI